MLPLRIDGRTLACRTVNRALGCAALVPLCGVHGLPCQSINSEGTGSLMPSHQTSPSGVAATLVKMQLRATVAMALALDCVDVPGATPKNPCSGLIAYSRPSAPGLIHAMSSPMVVTFQPSNAAGGISMAKLVLPHALGNAAATYVFSPCGDSTPRISICSASHPCSRPMAEAMRSARHFFPSSALPPYPLPNDQIAFYSGKCTMYFCSALQGQGTSGCPGASGMPTECRHGTKNSFSPSACATCCPMRVMIRMLTAT